MSPHSVRVAVAEADGWVWKPVLFGLLRTPTHPSGAWTVPNYPSDLTATRNVVVKLVVGDEHREFLYRTALTKICGGDIRLTLYATPDQCCEALLRTLGLWEHAAKRDSDR